MADGPESPAVQVVADDVTAAEELVTDLQARGFDAVVVSATRASRERFEIDAGPLDVSRRAATLARRRLHAAPLTAARAAWPALPV